MMATSTNNELVLYTYKCNTENCYKYSKNRFIGSSFNINIQ